MQAKILSAALRLSASKGLRNITRSMVAKAAGVAPGSVSYHFGGMDGLRCSVIDAAIERENLTVLAFALAMRHPAAARIAPTLKLRALASLAA